MTPPLNNQVSSIVPKKFECTFNVERDLVKDVVKATLSHILFFRTLGTIKPKTVELMGLTFMGTNDEESKLYIERQADSLRKLFDTKDSKGKVVIRFLEKRLPKKNWFGGVSQDTDISWEEWHITVECVVPFDDSARTELEQTTISQLQSFQNNSLKFVNQDSSHIPPITNSNVNPFPFQITSELVADVVSTQF